MSLVAKDGGAGGGIHNQQAHEAPGAAETGEAGSCQRGTRDAEATSCFLDLAVADCSMDPVSLCWLLTWRWTLRSSKRKSS